MFGSDLLEIGIGMVLVFLLVSLICSAAREALETRHEDPRLGSRARDRRASADPEGTGLTKAFFDHPMIVGLFGGTYEPAKLKAYAGRVRGGPWQVDVPQGRWHLPSYIPSGQFAAAILDLVVRGPVPTEPPTKDAPPAPPPPLSVASLRETAGSSHNEQVKRAMLSAIDYADDDIDKVKANIETWFNGTMDRVSGWYKRRTQMILFAHRRDRRGHPQRRCDHDRAAASAIDETLRQALVAQAESVVAKGAGGTMPANITDHREKGSPMPAIDRLGGPRPADRVERRGRRRRRRRHSNAKAAVRTASRI